MPSVELPKYKCHKIVQALKLRYVIVHDDGSVTVFPEERTQYQPFTIDRFVTNLGADYRDDPGYYVVYRDDYVSWSPTEAFEEGYARMGGQTNE